MVVLGALNYTLAFLIELAMLAAFAYAGWVGPEPIWLKIVLAIALPALAMVLWAVWAAPKAGKRRLTEPGLTLFKIAIFGVATAALWAAGQGYLATVFGVLAAINLIAAWALGQTSLTPRA
jgi:hypothetical protein